MKRAPNALFVLLLLTVFSCVKKNNDGPNSSLTGSVTINGTAYPTLIIGSQVWTTQNYRGPAAVSGGEADAIGTNVTETGNYYNTTNITLPAGWRVPTKEDFTKLLANYPVIYDNDGNPMASPAITAGLISTSEWTGLTGTNSTGFNAYPSGVIGGATSASGQNALYNYGTNAYFLTSTPYGTSVTDTFLPWTYMINNINSSYAEVSNMETYTYNSYLIPIQLYKPGKQPLYISVRFVKDK